MKLNFSVLPNFLSLWESDKRYIIAMGGRGAGRSTAASQFVVSKLPAEEYLRCAIMRALQSDVRHSIWREINDRIDEQNARNAFHITENDIGIKYGQNSVHAHGFRASSGSLTAKLKSLANYNTVVIEEAEEIGEGEFRTLDDTLRTVRGDIRIILCLNTPPKNHWIIKRWFDLEESGVQGFYIPRLKIDADAEYVTGTFEDNIHNLDYATIQRYKKYEETKPDYYYQMIRGLSPEVVRGKIYHSWELIDSVPSEARLARYGLDFGWYPDPACLVAVYYLNGGYIIDELAYGTELSNEYIAGCIDDKSVRLIADNAEPKSIDEIRKYGIKAEGCEKGSGSVTYGIKKVSEKRIAVTKRSKKVWRDYEMYAWAEDKDGNPKGEPAHAFSHAPDSIRYAIDSLSVSDNKAHTRRPSWVKEYHPTPIEKETKARTRKPSSVASYYK